MELDYNVSSFAYKFLESITSERVKTLMVNFSYSDRSIKKPKKKLIRQAYDTPNKDKLYQGMNHTIKAYPSMLNNDARYVEFYKDFKKGGCHGLSSWDSGQMHDHQIKGYTDNINVAEKTTSNVETVFQKFKKNNNHYYNGYNNL